MRYYSVVRPPIRRRTSKGVEIEQNIVRNIA